MMIDTHAYDEIIVKIFYSLLGVVKLFYAAAVSYAGMMGLSLTTQTIIS